MSEFKYLGKSLPRVDARGKVTGELKYPSDCYLPHQVWVKALRSAHPHAEIISVDTSAAEHVPGVVKVLTWKDIPGLNGYGIVVQDKPVLARDRVRYWGDAIALVGAETLEIAEAAVKLIKVEYQPLPVVEGPLEGMQPGAPQLHENGNVLLQLHFAKGDIEAAFAQSDVITEETYYTPCMDHVALEPAAGVSYYDEQGVLTVWAGGQHPYRDRTQIARALGLKNEQVRAIVSPTGGAFGGKDEITCQIHLALMTYHTQRPAKLSYTREEAFLCTVKRHAIQLHYKTGCTKDGQLTAVESVAYMDKGAYASLGGPVLCLVVEHACGPYLVPNTKIEGYAVYTNNGFGGAFRGFGATQATIAMEGQMDRMAAAIGMDPAEFRLKNAIHQGDTGCLGNPIPLNMGVEKVLKTVTQNDLWVNREQYKKLPDDLPAHLRPYRRRGVGVGAAMQGCGLGVGIPDYCQAWIRLSSDGTFHLAIGGVEMGQGTSTIYTQMIAEEFLVSPELVAVTVGDSDGPDSGPSTASRSTYGMGSAVYLACQDLRRKVLRKVAEELQVGEELLNCEEGLVYVKPTEATAYTAGFQMSLAEVAQRCGGELVGQGNFVFPTAKEELGEGLPHILYSMAAHVALVEVDTLTGVIEVKRLEAILDPGRVLNPLGVESQSDGGMVMGMSYALMEELKYAHGRCGNPHLTNYNMASALDMPETLNTTTAPTWEETHPYYAKGIGESVTVPAAPAIVGAIADAIGVRFTRLPVTPEMVIAALNRE